MGTKYTPPAQVRTPAQIQAEFEKVGVALEDALSRTGETPNQMEADLDMNGNSLLNVATDPTDPNSLVVRSDVYTKSEVDTKDANTLQEAKDYTDSRISNQGGLSAGDNVSLLVNDAGYITSVDLGPLESRVTAAEGNLDTNNLSISSLQSDVSVLENEMDVVQSRSLSNQSDISSLSSGKANKVVSPVVGNFVIQEADGDVADAGINPSNIATSTQGAKADSALQPGDNISELTNDSGYISGITAESVNSLSDVDTTGKSAGRILEFDASGNLIVGDKTAGATTTFVGLSDTPSAYAGQAGKLVTVNNTEDGVEFVDVVGAGLVDSVFGRVGSVVAVTGDYNSDQITNNSSVTGISVSDALEAVEAAIPNVSGKMDKLATPTVDAVVTQDAFGNAKNSGVLLSSLATAQSVSSLDTRVGNTESNITSLEGRVTVAESDIATLEGRATSLEAFEAQAGTAYTEDTQTSNLDTSTGALMAVGAFGLGKTASCPTWPQTSLNNVTGVGAGIYRATGLTTDRPTNQNGVVWFGVMSSSSVEYTQIYQPADSGETGTLYHRSSTGGTAATPTWSAWRQVWDEGNLSKSEFATAAQGALADTAVQPGDLATVATTGDYNDLVNAPSDLSQSIRKSLLDSPLCRLFCPNKLVDTLAGPLTWTRASTATYVDRYGVVRTAAIDEPREEADGWLFEGTSTNKLLYSNDFSNGVWQKFVSGAALPPTVTSDVADAPDGSLTADRLVFDLNGASSGYSAVAQNYTAAGNHTFSVWIKSNTGSNYTLSLESITSGLRTVVVTPKWQRFETSGVFTGTSTVSLRAYAGVASEVTDILVWGGQCEDLPFATSYIPTTTAPATRARDIVYTDISNNFLSGVEGDWSYSVNLKLLGSANHTIFGSPNATGNFEYSAIAASTGSVFLRDMSYANSATAPNPAGSLAVALSGVRDGTLLTQYLNGAPGNPSSPTSTTGFNFNEKVYLGSSISTGFYPLYGHLKDFRIYDFALNADEVQFLAGVK